MLWSRRLAKLCFAEAIWSWRRRMSGFARYSASLLLCAAAAFGFAPELPTAGEVLDRYVAVTGGAAAWHAKHTERDDIEGRTLDGQRVVLRATVTRSRSGNSLS